MIRPQEFKPLLPQPKSRAFTQRPVLRIAGRVVVGAVLLMGTFSMWVRHELFTPYDHEYLSDTISIPRGAGMRAIVGTLVDARIIRFRLPTLLWLKLSGGARSLKAGEYSFPSPISPVEVLARIERGEVVKRKAVIPEGRNRFEIAEDLAATGLADEQTFLALTSDASLIRDIDPNATSLEGYLFPDTYLYNSETTPRELIAAMVARFREVFTPELHSLAASRQLSIHDVVTMASMIEKEARLDNERPAIAAVFYNRLKHGMPLASDPTFVYAAILANDYDGDVNNPAHRQRNSPYNTYLNTGLPPGPIASPGTKSIMAAFYPAQNDYLYFVADGTTGGHRFSRSEQEHQRNVTIYRRQLRSLRSP